MSEVDTPLHPRLWTERLLTPTPWRGPGRPSRSLTPDSFPTITVGPLCPSVGSPSPLYYSRRRLYKSKSSTTLWVHLYKTSVFLYTLTSLPLSSADPDLYPSVYVSPPLISVDYPRRYSSHDTPLFRVPGFDSERPPFFLFSPFTWVSSKSFLYYSLLRYLSHTKTTGSRFSSTYLWIFFRMSSTFSIFLANPLTYKGSKMSVVNLPSFPVNGNFLGFLVTIFDSLNPLRFF